MLFELIILAGGIIGIFGGIYGWELPLLRSSIAGLMIIYGLSCYPYPKEDRHKIGLAVGCIVFVLSGIAAFLVASWWVLPIGVVAGFGATLCFTLIFDRSSLYGRSLGYTRKIDELNKYLPHDRRTGWYKHDVKELFKNGKPHGRWTGWHKNDVNVKASETRYKNGKKQGKCTNWFENGQKKLECWYKHDKLISALSWKPDGTRCPTTKVKRGSGVIIQYRANGSKHVQDFYEQGELHGLTTVWYESGQKFVERNNKNGKVVGLCTEWHENGQKKWEVHYKNGKKDGLRTGWHENGQKEGEGQYKDGKQEGLWTKWYPSGRKWHEAQYKNGEIVSRKEF